MEFFLCENWLEFWDYSLSFSVKKNSRFGIENWEPRAHTHTHKYTHIHQVHNHNHTCQSAGCCYRRCYAPYKPKQQSFARTHQCPILRIIKMIFLNFAYCSSPSNSIILFILWLLHKYAGIFLGISWDVYIYWAVELIDCACFKLFYYYWQQNNICCCCFVFLLSFHLWANDK